jgi:hypothetical protein
MSGVRKFLVGGLVGALVGLAVVPKRRKARKAQRVGADPVSSSAPVGTVEADSLTAEPETWPSESVPEPEAVPELDAETPAPAFEPTTAPAPAPSDEFAWAEPEEAPYVEYEPPAPSGPDLVDATPVFVAGGAALLAGGAEALIEEAPVDEAPVEEVVAPEEAPASVEEPAVEWRTPEPVADDAVGGEDVAESDIESPVTGEGWAATETEQLETVVEPEYEIVEVEPETIVEVDAPTAAGIADLKARIEETRRRIQQELDQPFAVDEEDLVEEEEPAEAPSGAIEALEPTAPPPVADVEVAEAVERPAQEPADEPAFFAESVETFEESSEIFVATETAAPAFEPAAEAVEEPAAEPVEEPIEGPEPTPDVEDEGRDGFESTEGTGAESVDAVGGDDFDHEAMRRRIEETRSRLKAKAFDAMMKGESALLGRDEEGNLPPSEPAGAEAPVDSDVAETIESALSEEEY